MLPFKVISQATQEDPEAWLAFRKTQGPHCIFGSGFPVWFGQLYGKSLNQYIKERHDPTLVKEPNDFARRAMDHGKTNERSALRLFKQCLENRTLSPGMDAYVHKAAVLLTDFKSSVLQSRDPVDPVVCMLTPDAAVLHYVLESTWDPVNNCHATNEVKPLSVVEVKCPWTQQFKFESLEEWVSDFNARHKYGYPSAFLQALLYGAVDDCCEQFFVLYYFVHAATNMRCMVSHRFALHDDLRLWCLKNAKEFSDLLRRGSASKLRVPTERKKSVEDRMLLYHREVHVTESEFITFELDEQSTEQPGNDA